MVGCFPLFLVTLVLAGDSTKFIKKNKNKKTTQTEDNSLAKV